MFIRKKKIGNNEYAYLVENIYNKKNKQSRQRSKKYLGKIVKISSEEDNKIIADSLTEAVINELISKGFSKQKNRLTNKSITIDLDSFEVKEEGKEICLEINEGFLCKDTLTNLLTFDTINLSQKETIRKLAHSLISAGINIHHDSIIKIFNGLNH